MILKTRAVVSRDTIFQSLGLEAVADPENFGGGGFEAKTSKIRMSSPKLRVIFRPKSEIQTFFSPKIRWSPKKKKRSSPKLRLIFRPDSLRLGRWGGCIPKWCRIIQK